MKMIQFAVIMALIAMPGCKSNTASDKAQRDSAKLVESINGRYAIKSGIIEYKINAMGMEQKQTTWFDDYGAKQASEIKMEMMGIKTTNITVTKDGFAYSYDPEEKKGTKTPVSPAQNIDFRNLTEQMQKDMKLEKLGEETVLGKPSVKYSINYDAFKLKGNYWVWQGIPMKAEIDLGGLKTNMEAVKIEENVAIPAEKFEIPKDVTFPQ